MRNSKKSPKRQNTNGGLSSYLTRLYDTMKPAEESLIRLGENIENKAQKVGNSLSEMTHTTLKSADGYVRKYEQ